MKKIEKKYLKLIHTNLIKIQCLTIIFLINAIIQAWIGKCNLRHNNQEQLELIRGFKLGYLNQDRMCKIIINHSQIIKLKKEIEHRVPIRILIEILFIYFKIKICLFKKLKDFKL